MKPVPFDYYRPDTLEETLPLLAEFGEDALILSGGLSLGAMLNMRVARPQIVIDINRIGGLAGIEREDKWIKIGAMVRQEKLARSVDCWEVVPLLVKGLKNVGHYQTRSRGTVGGSIAHADPSAEMPLCLLTIGGEVELSSVHGVRQVPAKEFFLGALETSCREDEMVTAIYCSLQAVGTGTAFEEICERKGDFAIVSAAAWARREGEKLNIGLGLGGVEDKPVAIEVKNLRSSCEFLPSEIDDFVHSLNPLQDRRASEQYRRQLAIYLSQKVIKSAVGRCHSEAY
ncbi:MAG: hypothetical protein CMM58_05285 [Rhodospirillaceae bacterium]|nr:hypothetical protein [Rhodospirillaceae bacterium]